MNNITQLSKYQLPKVPLLQQLDKHGLIAVDIVHERAKLRAVERFMHDNDRLALFGLKDVLDYDVEVGLGLVDKGVLLVVYAVATPTRVVLEYRNKRVDVETAF